MGVKLLKDALTPVIYIDPKCRAKINEYVAQSDAEVGWLGCVEEGEMEDGRKCLTIYDVYAPSQEVSGATTDLDASGVAEYAMRVDNPEDIRYWGHSHVNMGVTPSGQDWETLEELVEQSEQEFVMSIHNKAGNSVTNVYVGKGVVIEGVQMYLDLGEENIADEVAKELKENVRKKVYNYARSTTTNRNNSSKSTGKNAGTGTGGRSNRQSSSLESLQDGNAKSNLMGLRFN